MTVIHPDAPLAGLLGELIDRAVRFKHGLAVNLHDMGNDIAGVKGIQNFGHMYDLRKVIIVDIHNKLLSGQRTDMIRNFHSPLQGLFDNLCLVEAGGVMVFRMNVAAVDAVEGDVQIGQHRGNIADDIVVVKALKICLSACAGIHGGGHTHGDAQQVGVRTDVAVAHIQMHMLVDQAREHVFSPGVGDECGLHIRVGLHKNTVLDNMVEQWNPS